MSSFDWKRHSFSLSCAASEIWKFCIGPKKKKRSEAEELGVMWSGMYDLMRARSSEYASLMGSMSARVAANGRTATVWEFFLFYLFFPLLSGNQSVQRRWAPGEPTRHVARCSLSCGQDRENSDFSGATRRHGRGTRNFLRKVESGNGGNHPGKSGLKSRALQFPPQSWWVNRTCISHKNKARLRQRYRGITRSKKDSSIGRVFNRKTCERTLPKVEFLSFLSIIRSTFQPRLMQVRCIQAALLLIITNIDLGIDVSAVGLFSSPPEYSPQDQQWGIRKEKFHIN